MIGYCIAQYDYEATQPNQLSLSEGDRIGIISKAGEATGWWKGNNNGRVKYQYYQLMSLEWFNRHMWNHSVLPVRLRCYREIPLSTSAHPSP